MEHKKKTTRKRHPSFEDCIAVHNLPYKNSKMLCDNKKSIAGPLTSSDVKKLINKEKTTCKQTELTTNALPKKKDLSNQNGLIIDYDERRAFQKLLRNALDGDGQFPKKPKRPKEVARIIEEEIYCISKKETHYHRSIRSKVQNLKDKTNGLSRKLLMGIISPKELANMTCEEMASPELKKKRNDISKESLEKHFLPYFQPTESVALGYSCENCDKANCKIQEFQTRSANREMTNLVLCQECGKRWNSNS